MALCVVLEGRSVWLYLQDTGGYYRAALKICIAVTTICMCGIGLRISEKRIKEGSLCILIFSAYVGIYGLISDSRISTVTWWVLCVDAIIFELYIIEDRLQRRDIPIILEFYTNIITVIALVSVFFWLMGDLLNLIKVTSTHYYTWANRDEGTKINSYLGLYYSVGAQRALGLTISRNGAIFTEAPMAALHFTLSFLVEIYLKRKKSLIKAIVLVIAIMSTLSSAAIIVVMIAIICKTLLKRNKRVLSNLVRMMAICFLIVVGYEAMTKIIELKLQQQSWQVRLNDYEVGLEVWMRNVLLGCGFQNDKALRDAMPSWRSFNNGYSNSIMQLLAQGGVYLAFPYLVCVAQGVRHSISNREWGKCVFIVCFLALFTTSIFTYNYFSVMFLLTIMCFENMNEKGVCVQEHGILHPFPISKNRIMTNGGHER